MRCFLAIEVPDEVKNELVRIGKEFSFSGKYVEKENLHLTLKFLGEIDEKDIAKIREKIRKIKLSSFLANLGKIGIFPSEKLIRVLWVGVEPADKVRALYEEIEKILGNKPGGFESHITLARIKSILDKKEFLGKIKKINVKPIEFKVGEFVLKKSILTSKGSVYEDIERFILK